MKEIFTIFLFITFTLINGQELIAGHVVFRHGDRTPINTFPSDPIKENDWPNGFGQLTIVGIEQQYRLGSYIRKRYGSILSNTYNPNEVYVRSSNFDRTLMSAQSNLMGLYPVVNHSSSNISFQPIPVHTVSAEVDFLLGVSNCPRYDQIQSEMYQTAKFREMELHYKDFLEKLSLWTNITNMTLQMSSMVADTIFIEHLYNKTPIWATDEVRQNLTEIIDFLFYFSFINNDGKRMRGGPVIQNIWLNMNDSVHHKPYNKLQMYSAHDATLAAVLSFLQIDYPHQPKYASAVFLDLYRQNSTYFVQIEHLNMTDSNTTSSYLLEGCMNIQCPFNIFTSIYEPRFPNNLTMECAKLSPSIPRNQTVNKTSAGIFSVLIISTGIILFIAFFMIIFRKKRSDPPLLSQETFFDIA